jgi:hypothetical protein
MFEQASPGRDNLAGLTPAQRQLHREFVGAVAAIRHDFVRMVLLVREIADRRIYRLLGFATIAAYAEHYARFTESQTREFMALGGRLRAMDQVVAALGDGTLSWAKAREICRHADPRDQARWVGEARRLSTHDLHDLLTRPPAAAVPAPGESTVPTQSLAPSGQSPPPPAAALPDPPRLRPALPPRPAPASHPPAAPEICHVPLRFTPEQYARWEALLAARRAADPGAAREELVLDALAATGADPRRAGAGDPPHLIVLLHCPECDSARLVTSRGEAPVSRSLLEAAACDAVVEDHSGGRRHTIAPRLRRLALQHARFRCEAAGCRHAQFLQVHHRVPRELGGAGDLANLVVLCSRCHRALHEHEASATAAMQTTRAAARGFGRHGTEDG